MNHRIRSGQYIVVIGCGRLGSLLANTLSRNGQSVVVIDNEEASFGALAVEYSGFRIQGNAAELAVLKQAKIDRADVVIAATNKDNVNLMVAQVAKTIFSVPKVMARVSDPKREETYKKMGIETICTTSLTAGSFLGSMEKAGVSGGDDV